jgi:hypothetical protein
MKPRVELFYDTAYVIELLIAGIMEKRAEILLAQSHQQLKNDVESIACLLRALDYGTLATTLLQNSERKRCMSIEGLQTLRQSIAKAEAHIRKWYEPAGD